MGQLLTKVCYLLKGEAIIAGNKLLKESADNFDQLITMRWNDEISKVSRTELETRKWNKPQLLPLTEDLKKLRDHLIAKRQEAINDLARNGSDVKAWRHLCTSTLASIILLNRRRSGEVAKVKVAVLTNMRKEDQVSDEIKKSLSPFEVELCKSLTRVEIRGKHGRKVPMLLTKSLTQAIDLLMKTRHAVGILECNKFFFAVPSSLHYIRGSDALRKHVKLAAMQCPMAVTSTKLRKHIATLSQLLNLQENELEMLANFLGHDLAIHREFYRLPESTTQIAKCGKLLMLMEQGKLGDFAGKKLSEIELDVNGM